MPFCAVEVREKGFEEKISKYKDVGCVGIEEHASKILIDHELNLKLYKACAKIELPIMIHVATAPSGALDTVDLDGLMSD